MNNTDRLLRAFIEASGYEIKDKFIEPVDVEISFDEGLAVMNGFGANNLLIINGKYKRGDNDSYFRRVKDAEHDYKVTTTKAQVCFDVNGPEWSCIVDFVLAHREDIINDVNDYGGLGVMLDYFNRDS